MPKKSGSLAQPSQPRQNGLTNSIPQELHEQFQSLLLTWPLREKRGKVTIPESTVKEAEQTTGASWEFILEDQFGDEAFDHVAERMVKTYPTRKQALLDQLARLVEIKGLDPKAIYTVLNEAKQQAALAAVSGRGIDWRRHTRATYSRLRRKSEKIRQSLKELAQDRDLLWADADDAKEFERQGDALLDSLGTDIIMSMEGPGRRPGGAGPPTQPWIGEARTKLTKLHISRQNADTLLACVGLLSAEIFGGEFQHIDQFACENSNCPRAT